MPRKRSKSPKHKTRPRSKSKKTKSRSKSKNRKYGGGPIPSPPTKIENTNKYGFPVEISSWTRNSKNGIAEYYNTIPAINDSSIMKKLSNVFSNPKTYENVYPTYMERSIDKKFINVEWREGPVDNYTYRNAGNIPKIRNPTEAEPVVDMEKEDGLVKISDKSIGIPIEKSSIAGYFNDNSDRPCRKIYVARGDNDCALACKIYFHNGKYYTYIFTILNNDGYNNPFLWYQNDLFEDAKIDIESLIQNPSSLTELNKRKEKRKEKRDERRKNE